MDGWSLLAGVRLAPEIGQVLVLGLDHAQQPGPPVVVLATLTLKFPCSSTAKSLGFKEIDVPVPTVVLERTFSSTYVYSVSSVTACQAWPGLIVSGHWEAVWVGPLV